MAGVARLRLPDPGAGTGPILAGKTPRTGLPHRCALRLQRHHALYQHHSGRTPARIPRRPRNRTPHQEHHPLERHGDGRPREQAQQRHRRAYLDLRLGRHAVRSGLQPLLPRQAGHRAARPGLFPGACHAGNLRPGVSPGPLDRAAPGELPPRVAARRRAVLVSAPLAHARLLGVPHGLDGAGADHGHLPGPLQPLPGRSRHQARRHRPRGSGPSWATASATNRKRWAPSPWPPARGSTT